MEIQNSQTQDRVLGYHLAQTLDPRASDQVSGGQGMAMQWCSHESVTITGLMHVRDVLADLSVDL